MAPTMWSAGTAGVEGLISSGHHRTAFANSIGNASDYLLQSLGKVANRMKSQLPGAASPTKSGLSDETEAKESDSGADGVLCNWQEMKLGNNTNIWKTSKPDIKYAYDNDLKGQEVKVWWPGRAAGGECSNIKDGGRGCWYTARMLNDVGCRETERCLHVAAHDGEPRHTFTCPTWVRNAEGQACRLPPNWQDCPPSFVLKRVDTGVPQEFKKALAVQCAKSPEEIEEMLKTAAQDKAAAGAAQEMAAKASKGPKDHCLGSTKALDDVNMMFDIRHNSWYRCGQNFKCEPYDIRKIKDASAGVCGEPGKSGKVCRDGQFCFVHRVTSKRSTYECMDGKKVFLLSEGDDVAKFAMPAAPLLLPPPAPRRGGVPPDRRGRFL